MILMTIKVLLLFVGEVFTKLTQHTEALIWHDALKIYPTNLSYSCIVMLIITIAIKKKMSSHHVK